MPFILLIALGVGVAALAYHFGAKEKEKDNYPRSLDSALSPGKLREPSVPGMSTSNVVTPEKKQQIIVEVKNELMKATKAGVSPTEIAKIKYSVADNIITVDMSALSVSAANEINSKISEAGNSFVALDVKWLVDVTMPFAAKEEVKVEAKAELTKLLEGRTLKDTEGKLFVLRRSTKVDCWNMFDASDPKEPVVKDMTYEDIKSSIDSGEFTLT